VSLGHVEALARDAPGVAADAVAAWLAGRVAAARLPPSIAA
jgi:hypothetical protein